MSIEDEAKLKAGSWVPSCYAKVEHAVREHVPGLSTMRGRLLSCCGRELTYTEIAVGRRFNPPRPHCRRCEAILRKAKA